MPRASVGPIVVYLVCALASGIATAMFGRERARGAVSVLSALLLVTGILVQSGVWALMPVWYHLTFLALIVPATVLTGRLVAPGTARA